MKSALTAILFFLVSGIAYSQFSVTSAVGYGLKVNSELDYNAFQSSISVSETYKIDKFKVGSIQLGVNDSTASFFVGVKTSYEAWKIDEDRDIEVSAATLTGFNGELLAGVGVFYNYKDMFIGLDNYFETKNKEYWGILNVGLYISR